MNLVAEQRTDKNGHVVTRWVKPEQGGTAAPQIPSVALPVHLPFDRVAYIDELLSYWDEFEVGYSQDEVADRFWELEDSTLLTIDLVYEGGGDEMFCIYEWVAAYGEENEEHVRELMTYLSSFKRDTAVGFIQDSVLGIRDWGDVPVMDDYSQADEGLQEGIRAVLKVNEAAYADAYLQPRDQSIPLLIPKELRQLILSAPEKVDRIQNIVTTRNTVDAELVSLVLSSEAASVSEGIL